MIPNEKTVFKQLHELSKYIDSGEWCCSGIVFEPKEAGAKGCPPYIILSSNEYVIDDLFFEIPATIAYYAVVHRLFTIAGHDELKRRAKRELANDIKKLLDIRN